MALGFSKQYKCITCTDNTLIVFTVKGSRRGTVSPVIGSDSSLLGPVPSWTAATTASSSPKDLLHTGTYAPGRGQKLVN